MPKKCHGRDDFVDLCWLSCGLTLLYKSFTSYYDDERHGHGISNRHYERYTHPTWFSII
jgi:hypothetical protein